MQCKTMQAGSLQQVENELSAFKSMLSSNASFVTYLENPSVSKDEKMSKINELMPADKFSDVTRNLLEVVSANSRISDVPKIITSFEELMNASKGVVKVVIMSADKLKAADVTAATKAVTGMLEKGQTAEVTTEVDPSIMGGLQVKIGDRFLDLSVQQRIADIGKSLDVAE
jgi:F-type H+-transporting ATPase subunit O